MYGQRRDDTQPLTRALALAALAALLGCGSVFDEPQIGHTLAATTPGGTLCMGEISTHAWEDLVVLGPYATQAQADAALGFAWKGFSRTGVHEQDSYHVLVFATGTQVVRTEKIGRCQPDFDEAVLGRRIPRADACFTWVLDGRCPTLAPR